MACINPLNQLVKRKSLFVMIIIVIIGIAVSYIYIISEVLSGSNFVYPQWMFREVGSSTRTEEEILSPLSESSSFSTRMVHSRAQDSTSLTQINSEVPPHWEVPPRGSKMPPLESFKLTKELVQKRVKNNIVVVTFGNFAFTDFIMNWVKHLSDMGVDNLLVGAMDMKVLETLYWKGIPVFDMDAHLSTADFGWGTQKFNKMGREKVALINALLPLGFEILMTDTDTVWLKNPLPYLARYPEADLLTSTDQLTPTVADDQLEDWSLAGASYNIGLFHWRSTESTIKLAKEWEKLLLADENMWDQNGFVDLLRKKLGPSVDGGLGLVYAYDGKLKLGVLPASIFCSGHTFFVQGMHWQFGLKPYAVHTTFQFSNKDGKRHRLREAMLFNDPPEYYDSPGGFLTFKAGIPPKLLFDGKHNVETHFALVNYQMKQIRNALAMASLSGRTLVMPPVWCRLDRLWYWHPGVIPGSLTRQPFICPLDHVFAVDNMLNGWREDEFGAHIDFREYTFFDNPSLSHKVKDSWLDVHLCDPKSRGCEVLNDTSPTARVLKFPKQSTEETLKSVFSLFKDVKVIQFSSMQETFLGFSNKTEEELFRKRVKRYTGLWCCVENMTPGHIYYDMYWDEKPNWKPVPPQTREEDHPPY